MRFECKKKKNLPKFQKAGKKAGIAGIASKKQESRNGCRKAGIPAKKAGSESPIYMNSEYTHTHTA